MPGIDSSIYNNLQPPQSNALQLVGQVAQVAQQVNQNRLFQQEFQSRAAMGPILQQSIGSDGQVDYAKAALLMAQNPATAFKAPEFVKAALDNQGVQLDNQLKQWNITKARLGLYGDAAASLGYLGDKVSTKDVAERISDLYSTMQSSGLGGDGQQEQLLQFIAKLPAGGPPLAKYLKDLGNQSQGAAATIGQTLGQFQTIDAGGQQHLFFTHPQTGEITPVGPIGPVVGAGGTIAKTPTPAELNAPVETTGPDGGKVTTPRFATPGMPMANGGGGVMPTASGTSPNVAPGAAPAPAMGAVTALPPDTQRYLADRGANMADYQKQLNTDTQALQGQMTRLSQLQDLTKKFKSGGGANVRKELGTLLQAFGAPKTLYDKVANGDLAASQEFEKYTTQATMDVLRQAIGGQGRLTNLEFEQFLRSNPNLNTSGAAIKDILKLTQKVATLKIAEQKGLDAWVRQGKSVAEFPAAWTDALMKHGILRPYQQGDER